MNIKSVLFAIHTITSAAATTLYASHYDGHIFTLSLSASQNGSTSLTLASTLQACGEMPSWLMLDAAEHVLYCVDESGTKSYGNGSLSSFAISSNGSLAESSSSSSKVTTMPGGVASVIYQAGDNNNNNKKKKKFLAIAHYAGAALSTFQLPLTPDSQPNQVFTFTLTEPVADPSRQDTSHPHEVFLDPTGKYILSPDLGADLIRVFTIASDGILQECDPFKVTAGNGPRHGAFYPASVSNDHNTTTLYIVNELSNTLSTYAVEYTDDDSCLSLSTLNETTPYPTTPLPSNAYVSEIRIPDNDIYISIRSDQGFAPNDSLATLELVDGTGPLAAFKNLSSSYGTVPRTFALSPDGSMVAIGNQASSNVAVVARDVETGQLGELLGSVQVGSEGQPGQSNGLSSVIWGNDHD
ncbi:hypothetical protein UA08_09032 [Talaromyces atroroseus]|uniref:6-phosphogluconolactonase n=1 Tax=Talaromyces atroroseus TaxID=1441469 RepID=A0A1Q5Q761_TALAT|nr:hypothetical protein UA08_09032 [Talaromyces atroroseus]OKL55603.1 hypothetical protein UA08_09032 [Talaromyces atroroseus]